MESLDNTSKHTKSFIKEVFNFDEDSRGELLNIIQYALIAVVPIIIVNKLMQKYIPEADDEKGSLELTFEVVFQIILIFTSLFFIHRIAAFFPTYSGIKYPEFSVIYIVLSALMILLSLQTKLGEKVSILTDRVLELWNGGEEEDEKDKKNLKGGKKNVKGKKQPQQQNQQQMHSQNANTSAMTQALYGSTPINSLPPHPQQPQHQQQLPDYNNMYQNTPTPLPDANIPGSSMTGGFGGGIMAANEAFGGMYGTGF